MAKRVPENRKQPPARPSPGVNSAQAARPLLQRILDTPHLAQVVPRLPGEVLHRVIERCGLEDCGEVVALATPAQLLEVFDLDLWRPGEAGQDELFDAARFGVWLRVLVDAGAAAAAAKLARIDPDLLVTAFAQHVRVFDPAALALMTEDGEEVLLVRIGDELRAEIGGYLVVARRDDAWDAIVEVFDALSSAEPDCFDALMTGCRRLSNSDPEVDGLDDLLADPEQGMFDAGVEREQRREKKGYITPAQARAFLHEARQLDFSSAVPPVPGAVARAYFNAIEPPPLEDAAGNLEEEIAPASVDGPAATNTAIDPVAELLDVLRDAGVVPQPPRALLENPGPSPTRLALLHAHMRAAFESDPAVYSKRGEELAYLANVLVAACPIQGRSMTPQEASDAAAATCNLGLENFPPQWMGTADQNLIRAFEVGWAILHRDVSMYAAGQLVSALRQLRVGDPETQAALNELRMNLKRHLGNGVPWLARDDFDVIAGLDMLTWAALLGLVDQCPSIHGAIVAARNRRVLKVSASAFEFIAVKSQIDGARDYLASLLQRLGP